jgi:biopolymer transport protein ExbD
MFRRKRRQVPGINTTSTADISFMLLVFFLVTSSMDTDKGLPSQMPPPENMEEVQEQMVKERNVLALEIDASDRLTCNKEEITPQELTRRVEEFVANTANDPKLPEKSVREVHLMGRCEVSDRHVITIRADRNSTYNTYIEMRNAIVAGYNNIRNRLAIKKFRHSLSECSQEEHDAILMVYPQRISEKLNIE